jgi:ribosome-associated protein
MTNDPKTDVRPSKTRRKQAMHALQDIGERLVQIDHGRLRELCLPERLTEAILEAGRMHQHGARRRQMQYIGRLMRDVDAAPILEKLERWSGTGRRETARLHLLERWRARLLEDEGALSELVRICPGADVRQLHLLVRNTRREALAGGPPKSFRALFQALRDTIPESPRQADTTDEDNGSSRPLEFDAGADKLR